MVSLSGESAGSRRQPLSQLDEGAQLARSGERERAREIFRRIIHATPECEDAWLWLAWVAETPAESTDLLREAQLLFPKSERVGDALRWVTEGTSAPEAAADFGSEPVVTEVTGAAVPSEPVPTPPVSGHKSSLLARVGQGLRAVKVRPARQPATSQSPCDAPGQMAATEPSVAPQQRSAGKMPLFSYLAVGLIVVIVFLAVWWAVRAVRVPTVQALVLPTVVSNPTEAPALDVLAAPLLTSLNTAWDAQDWDSAITALQSLRQLDPTNTELRKRLALAYYQRGQVRLGNNLLSDALIDFDEAIRLDADNADLQTARHELKLYLSGLAAYQVQDWASAVDYLKKVDKGNAAYRDCQPMLARAYSGLAKQLADKSNWVDAQATYEQALALEPDLQDAQEGLAAVKAEVTPPRRIEVSLSEYVLRVYENNEITRTFSICTGRATAPTQAGRYQVLDKMPMAYGAQWDLQMPWWIGLYYAGTVENGFHALPILSNGATLWSGSLGSSCSYGCMVLGTADAEWLYNWADIGTVVYVNP